MLKLKKHNTLVIFMTLFTVFFCVGNAKGEENNETFWQRLLISYDNWVNMWGYDMSNSTLSPSDYWVNNNWKTETMFSYSASTREYKPWVSKIDDNHIALHNLMKDFCGLFQTDEDLTLVGELDIDNMTITFQPQEYADGYIFASGAENGNNNYSYEELQPVTINVEQSSTWSFLYTALAIGNNANVFALYKLNEGTETYSATIGMCGFSLRGKSKVVSYIFYPTYASVKPSDNPITEIQSIVLTTPSEVYENPNITDPITVKKGDETLDVSVTSYPDRDNLYRYVIELETPLTEVGTYTITIPKGLIGNKAYSSNEFTNGNANPELTYSFTIVNIEELYYDFNLVSSDPANGETLDRLSQFKLTFASPVSINEVYVSDIKGIGNGTVTVDESDANSVIITLGSEHVNAGEYTFSFPQGVFGDAKYGENFTVGHANPAFEVKYTISGKYQMFYDLEPTEINPKASETYDEVTEAKITFDVPVVINEEVAATAFMYKDSYQQSNPISSIVVSSDDNKTVIVTFTNPLVEAGLYYITIPQGSIGDATYGIDYTYGHANKEFSFRYKISGNGLLKYDFEYVTTEPTDNQSVDRLETITLTFDAPVAINEALASGLKCGDVAVKSVAVDEADNKTVVVTLDSEIVEAGNYTISFPQGLFGDTAYGEAFKAGHASPAFDLTYTVTGNAGIDGVMMDGENGAVEFFNLQGVKVNQENLAPGIYIRKSGNKAEKVCIR